MQLHSSCMYLSLIHIFPPEICIDTERKIDENHGKNDHAYIDIQWLSVAYNFLVFGHAALSSLFPMYFSGSCFCSFTVTRQKSTQICLRPWTFAIFCIAQRTAFIIRVNCPNFKINSSRQLYRIIHNLQIAQRRACLVPLQIAQISH